MSNLINRTIFHSDNIDILKAIDSFSVDLIYLDPPFNTDKKWHAPIGTDGKIVGFKDTWKKTDIREADLEILFQAEKFTNLAVWLQSINAMGKQFEKNFYYLLYMVPRIIEMHRVLKKTGSIYLHCDPTMSHYLKIIMDYIFGMKNFRNEVVWCYKENDVATKHFPKKHDVILFYSKTEEYNFMPIRGEITEAQRKRYNHDIDGEKYANMKGKMRKLEGGAKVRDWWEIPIVQSQERTGWPTQKPLALLERIIKASSNEGDMVLDPFCGCATAMIAAERLERQWVGIDVSPEAHGIITRRLQHEIDPAQLQLWKKQKLRVKKEIGLINTQLKPLSQKKKSVYKTTLFGEQGGKCTICERLMDMEFLEIDHIHPTSKGGNNGIENLQLLCRTCNGIKSNKTMAEALSKAKNLRSGIPWDK